MLALLILLGVALRGVWVLGARISRWGPARRIAREAHTRHATLAHRARRAVFRFERLL
jgi:hypothetical protein